MEKFKIEAISFAQTFVSSFFTIVAVTISQVSPDNYSQFATNGFWASIILSSARTAVKLTWQKTLPVSIGGVK